jgi:TonB-linked SusC/RagA family outer membrane protein
VYLEAEIIKGLKYKVDLGYDYSNGINEDWTPVFKLGKYITQMVGGQPTQIFSSIGARSNTGATLTQQYNDNREWIFNNTLTYSKSFGSHNLTLMAGASEESVLKTNFNVGGSSFSFPTFPYMSEATVYTGGGGATPYTFQSEFGRVLYDYKSRYLITASLRRDGSSRFGSENLYGTFPSFSLGWKINEDFLKDVKQIDMIKLRFGWGQTGNDNLGDFQFASYIDAPSGTSRYSFGSPQTPVYGAAEYSHLGNPALKWEASEMTNAGIDVNLFKNQIFFTGEYYVKNQNNMLVQEQIPYAAGLDYQYSPWVNLGQVMNEGFDFNLSYRKAAEKEGGFSYSISGMLTTMKNKVIALASGNVPIVTNETNITQVGNTIGSMYGYVCEGIFQKSDFDAQGNIIDHAYQAGAKPGDFKFKDLNGDGIIDASDRTIIGKPLPDFNYGLTLNGGYANFDVSIFIQGVQGVQIYDALRAQLSMASSVATDNDQNKLTDILNYWTPNNTNTMIPRLDKSEANNNARISSRWIENGSYARLQSVQIG